MSGAIPIRHLCAFMAWMKTNVSLLFLNLKMQNFRQYRPCALITERFLLWIEVPGCDADL